MQYKPRGILIATILGLVTLLLLWMDELASKQIGILGYKYEVIKIVLHTAIAYKASKFIISKLDLNNKFKSWKPVNIFIITFLVLNAYIIIQYSTRTISHRIVNREIRKELGIRTTKIEHVGCGYECDYLTLNEYKEITKHSEIIKLPNEASSIFVHDWYEMDFNRTVEFSIPIGFRIHEFYKNDTTVLNNLNELKYGQYVSRYKFQDYTGKRIQFDTSKYQVFRFQVDSE